MTSIMVRSLTGAFALAAAVAWLEPAGSSSRAAAAQLDAQHELAQIEQRLARAWLDGDRATISAILDPEWRVIDIAGRSRTKTDVLDEMFASSARPIAAMTVDDVVVRMFGEAGIVTGRTTARGNNGESVVLRFTDVFLKRGDRWQIVASQGTPVTGAAAAPHHAPALSERSESKRPVLSERSESKRTALSEQSESKGWKANPAIVQQVSQKIPNANFEEARVAVYTLPDPLETSRGRVRNAEDWRKRRAEILELFREHVYGRRPGKPDRLEFQTVEEDARAMDGKATLKRVAVLSRHAGRDHRFEITLFLPNAPAGRVPVFLLLNNRSSSDTNAARQQRSPFWPAEDMIRRGYGIAAIQNGDLAPDDKARFRDGIMRLFEENASAARAGNAWGALAAWGWGASRAMDYFETDRRIDAGKVAVLGHSRGGKAALWAGAEDERFALVISNESGEGGAALTRRNFGETLQRITTTFPHWFAENYKAFAGREETLPVDQHMLLALMAPRAIYVASADEDLWADPRGEFLALAHASPVYALFGGDPAMNAGEMPPLNAPLVTGRRAYHVRTGTHNLTPYDWERFADFADRLWREP